MVSLQAIKQPLSEWSYGLRKPLQALYNEIEFYEKQLKNALVKIVKTFLDTKKMQLCTRLT